MEIFFAKLFGIYFVVVGIIVLVRRQSIMPAVRELVESRALILVLAIIEFTAGMALILAYPTPSISLSGVISLVGWVMTIESLLYLALPSRLVQKYVRWFNTSSWYIGGGALSVTIGVYLALTGFGLI